MSCDDVADLVDLAPEDLDDLDADARAGRAAHLEACAGCRALAGAHALAARALAVDAEPDDAPSPLVRERLLGAAALLHKQLAEPEPVPALAPGAELRVRLRCTYCHGDLEAPRTVYCADCLAPVHAGCFDDHGRCPAPGCGGTRVVEPRDPRERRTRGRARRLGALLLGLAIAGPVAAWALAWREPVVVLTEGVITHEASPAPVAVPAPVTTTVTAPADDPGRRRAEAPPVDDARPTLRVLYVEGQPRWEYRYLKNALLRDRHVHLQCLLLSADPDFEQEHSRGVEPLRALPAAARLNDYDVIVLGDVAAADEAVPWLYAGAFQAVAAAVREGAGLLVIDGAQSNRAWAETALGPLLPVRFAATAPRLLATGPFRPARSTPTPGFLRLEPEAMDDERTWSGLPALEASIPVERATGDATVFLTRDDGPRPAPLLASRREGKGVVAWLGVDEVWRWRAGVGDRYMARFYGQLLRAIDASTDGPAPMFERVLHLDGREEATRVERVARLDGEWVVVTADGRRTPLGLVKRIRLSATEPPLARAALVLRDGTFLRGAVAGGGGDVVSFTTDTLGSVSVPFGAVRALVLDASPDGALDPTRWRAPDRDRIVLRDASLPVEGALTGVDAHEVRVQTDFGRMAVPLARVGRVDWAALDVPVTTRVDGPRARVTLDDGTVACCTLIELDQGALRAHHDVLGSLVLARRHVLWLDLE